MALEAETKSSAKSSEDLQVASEKVDHLNKVKSKLESTLDELESSVEKEKRSRAQVVASTYTHGVVAPAVSSVVSPVVRTAVSPVVSHVATPVVRTHVSTPVVSH